MSNWRHSRTPWRMPWEEFLLAFSGLWTRRDPESRGPNFGSHYVLVVHQGCKRTSEKPRVSQSSGLCVKDMGHLSGSRVGAGLTRERVGFYHTYQPPCCLVEDFKAAKGCLPSVAYPGKTLLMCSYYNDNTPIIPLHNYITLYGGHHFSRTPRCDNLMG